MKSGAILVSVFAIVLGGALGWIGIDAMLDAGSFASAESESRNGILGIGGGSSQSTDVGTPAWVGLLVALVGASAFLFGLRALYATFEGREA